MKKPLLICLVCLLAASLTACGPSQSSPSSSPAPSAAPESTSIVPQPSETPDSADTGERDAQAAYLALLQGDVSLVDDPQTGQDWLTLRDSGESLEYALLDLDGDGISELLLQASDSPQLYSAVFHYAGGTIFCWQYHIAETSCWDYPLQDGTMVRQCDTGGETGSYVHTYTLFHYNGDGSTTESAVLSIREDSAGEDAPPAITYTLNGEALDQADFDAQFEALIGSQILDHSAWNAL